MILPYIGVDTSPRTLPLLFRSQIHAYKLQKELDNTDVRIVRGDLANGRAGTVR